MRQEQESRRVKRTNLSIHHCREHQGRTATQQDKGRDAGKRYRSHCRDGIVTERLQTKLSCLAFDRPNAPYYKLLYCQMFRINHTIREG